MTQPHKNRRRRGVSFIWMTVAVTMLAAMASLAVDYGRVQIAKTQLREAADAAARAGASALGSVSSVQDLASQLAASNTCDGTPVLIDKNLDVEFGDWDPTTRTFNVLTGANRNFADSVRVTCRRLAARGNPIPLMFGKVLGQSACDVQAYAIAAVIPPDFGLVGLDYISLKGNATASYWSSSGSVGGNAGNVASNGNIISSSNATISGTVWTLPGAAVTGVSAGARKTLTSALNYPNGDPSPYSYTLNDNGKLSTGFNGHDLTIGANKTVTIQAGHYVVQNFSVASTAKLTFGGPVTIYFYGTVNVGGQTVTNGNAASNFKLVGIPGPTGAAPGGISLSGGTALYASIYAPQSDITASGTGAIYGSILGKSVTLSGSSDIYYDLNLNGTTVIQLVK